MGEHGDTEFVPWSQAMVATKSITELCEESHGSICAQELEQISEEVRTAAYKIIEAKNATYYGIGMALTRITKAILGNEHSVLTCFRHAERGIWAVRHLYRSAMHYKPERSPERSASVAERGRRVKSWSSLVRF